MVMNSSWLIARVLCPSRPVGRSQRNMTSSLLTTLVFGVLCIDMAVVQTLGDTVSLTSVADTYIRQSLPDLNGGAEPTMVSGELGDRAQFELRRSLLRFDPGGIPAGSTVNSVTLRLTVVMVPLTPANSIFDVRRVLQDWSEFGVSWNSRMANAAWQVPGAVGGGDVAGAPSSSVFVAGTGQYTFSSTPALVADVQGWVNNPASNFGWLLISQNESTPHTARRFGTREDANNAPVLLVDYTPSSTPTISIVTQPQSQSAVIGSTVSLNVVAGGTPPFSYQWFFNGNQITNATNDTLILSNVQTNQSGSYTVTVTNASGSVASKPGILRVFLPELILPTIRITAGPPNQARVTNSPITLVGTATDNIAVDHVEYQVV